MLEELRQQFHRIAGHRGIRRYGANTLWMLAEKGCRLVFGFLVGIYVARQLGPARYGLLNYAVSFVALFSVLATLGMDPVVVRELVRRPGKANSILGSALGLKAAGFAVMAFVVGIVLLVSPMSDSDRGLMAVILAGYGFQVFQIFDFSFQARVLGKYSAMSQIAALAVSSGFRLWFAWQGAPLWCFAAVESGYMALSAFGYALFYRKTGGCFRLWRFDRAEAAFLLRESLPLLLAGKDILFVGMSSGISGSYASSEIAAAELREQFPERMIRTVDTLAAALGEGILVMHAVDWRDAGLSIDEIADLLLERRHRVAQIVLLDDLMYLSRGGRLSGAKALIGTVLGIRPVGAKKVEL